MNHPIWIRIALNDAQERAESSAQFRAAALFGGDGNSCETRLYALKDADDLINLVKHLYAGFPEDALLDTAGECPNHILPRIIEG